MVTKVVLGAGSEERHLMDRGGADVETGPVEVSGWMNLPEGFAPAEPLFVATDIHGCTRAFDRLLRHLPSDARFIFLGDAMDRGPDPIGVLERLLSLKETHRASFCCGNHDAIAWFALKKDCPDAESFRDLWYFNGGEVTENAFRDAYEQNLPQSEELTIGPVLFEDYWKSARNWHISGNIFFVHGGFPPGAGERFLDMDPLRAASDGSSPYWWRPSGFGRKTFWKPRVLNGKEVFTIVGHTPVNPGLSLQDYGILLDLGYGKKRAVEIRENRFRTIDTDCDEIC